jgi:hypothetical protein
MTASAALRTYRDLRRILQRAIEQAKLAYQFNPGTYTYSAMSACMAAEQALEVLRDHMSDHFETSNPD